LLPPPHNLRPLLFFFFFFFFLFLCGSGRGRTWSSYCDTTPVKQGKFSPGVHIPVVPYARFQESPPDCALLFAWNHAAEILEKESVLHEEGRPFIVYVPKVGYAA
jgi:methylation protein EvaC